MAVFCCPSKEAFPSPNEWRSRLLKTRYVVYNFVALYFFYLFWLAGHELYMQTVDSKPPDIPRTIREQEFAKINEIGFEIKSSATLCCLKVKFI